MPPRHRALPALALAPPPSIPHPLPVALWGAGRTAEWAAESPAAERPGPLWDLQLPLLAGAGPSQREGRGRGTEVVTRESRPPSPPRLCLSALNSHPWAPAEVLSWKEGPHAHQPGSPGVEVPNGVEGWAGGYQRSGAGGLRADPAEAVFLPPRAHPHACSRSTSPPAPPALRWPPPHPRENLKSSLRAPLPRHPCRVSSHRSLLCMGTLSPDLETQRR